MTAGATECRVSRGFTLLEIMLVLALIALATLLAAAALSGGVDGLRLRSAAKEVAAQLRFTRAQALATGESQQFVIDPRTHAWTAPKGRHGELAPKFAIVFTGAREAQPAQGQGAIVFFADGASTGGRVRLALGDTAWQIDVAWLTGQVKLARAEQAQR